MQSMLPHFYQQIVQYSPKLAVSIAVLILFWIIAIVVKFLVSRIGNKITKNDTFVVNLLAKISKSTLMIVGIITALGTAGINVTALVTGLGLTGFALGFAFKDALSNILAGIMILLYHPFKHNDTISILTFEGIVVAIDLRYTTLQVDNKHVLIPNSLLLNNSIVIH